MGIRPQGINIAQSKTVSGSNSISVLFSHNPIRQLYCYILIAFVIFYYILSILQKFPGEAVSQMRFRLQLAITTVWPFGAKTKPLS